MLGSRVLAVRLGGIYALQRLAGEHERYHVPIMQLFCTFVCSPPKTEDKNTSATSGEDGQPILLRPDLVAIMQAIASRSTERISLEQEGNFRLDFRHAKLDALDLLRIGDVNLSRCILTDSDLSHVQFPPEANFSRVCHAYRAKLCWARLIRVNLEFSNLMDADLSESLLSGAKLCCADLRNANLSNAILAGADLSGAELRGANLSGAKFSFDDQPPARGLTQDELDLARAEPENPPNLDGVVDTITGRPLVWRGKTVEDQGSSWGERET